MFRTLAFIENDMYVRNFIISGAFDLLMQEEGFGICVSEIVSKLTSSIPSEKIVGTYRRCDANITLVFIFNWLSIRALRKKSSTFDIKVKAGWPFGGYSRKARLASTPVLFNHITKKLLIRKFENNPTLETIITKHEPNFVIFPITGVESTGVELINLSRKYGFKTFFLVNGWDNLSSKGVLPLLPDYLGVWGPQSFLDAVNIQGMRSHRAFMLGCARYEDYFAARNGDALLFPFKYILFAGATTPNDEIAPLRLFENVLEGVGNTEIKIVYRPHPWREKRLCFDSFEPEKFKHVILDPQVADDYLGEKRKGTESSSSQNFPSLGYYPSLLNHARFMISPMSSMTLEAALFDVPSMVLAHDDGYHSIPGNLQARYKHFEGATEVPGWFFVHHFGELEHIFRTLLLRFKNETPTNREFRPMLSSAMKKYLYWDGRSYAQRLHEAVNLIKAVIEQGQERSSSGW